MAITWDVSITNVDVSDNRADVAFTRTDSDTGSTERYSFKKAIIGTGPQRAALLDTVWAKHEDSVSEQSAVDAFITNLEQTGKSNLELREV